MNDWEVAEMFIESFFLEIFIFQHSTHLSKEYPLTLIMRTKNTKFTNTLIRIV